MNSFHWLQQQTSNQTKSSTSPVKVLKKIKKAKDFPCQPSPSIRSLYKERKLNELVKMAKSQGLPVEEFDQIRIQGQILHKGDVVMIKNQDQGQDFLGLILAIETVQEMESKKLICLCRIQWFCRREEVLSHRPRFKGWISESEVFRTESKDYVLAQTIMAKCSVVKQEEFLQLRQIDANTFFSRLTWDSQRKNFVDLATVERYCICDQPWNPDQQYIQCDKCLKWYHFSCVGLPNGSYEDREYFCGHCS